MRPETIDLIKTIVQFGVLPLLFWVGRTLMRLEESIRTINQWAFGVPGASSPGADKRLKHVADSSYRNTNNVHALAGAIEMTRVQAGLDPLDLKLLRGNE